MTDHEDDKPFEYPIDGTLDLHMFSARETREVVLEYIAACLCRRIHSLRIVHGKGRGVKRRIVQSILAAHPDVAHYYHEGGSGGSWGATIVDLKEP
jgi:DNA-nicking Smr family endonuclease